MKRKKYLPRYIQFIIAFWHRIEKDELFALGAQTSYYLILALFPFISLIVIITSSNQEIIDATLRFLYLFLPTEAYNVIYKVISQTIEASTGALFSASALIAFYLPMRTVVAIIRVLNKAYAVKETRSLIKVLLLAFIITLLFIPAITLVLTTLVFGKVLGSLLFSVLGITQWFSLIWNYIRYSIALLFMLLFFMVIYRFLPNHQVTWRETIPGACLATFGWLIASLGFAWYVNNFNSYSVAYGSLAGLFILLIWLYISSTIILCGGELNAMLAESKYSN